ncbi:integrin alpha [Streptomyces sp. NPDC058864]
MSAVVVSVLGGALVAVPSSARAASGVAGDINHDGYRDLVISAPDATVAGRAGAGAVVILYGSAGGFGKRAVLTQDSAGIPGSAEAGDHFGASAAVHDVDLNGYSDLVIGAPGEEVSGDIGGGLVTFVHGSSTTPGKAFTVGDPSPYEHDAWGRTLAVGTFDGYTDNGRPVIAVGANDNGVYYMPATAGGSWLGGVGVNFNPKYAITSLVTAADDTLVVSGRGQSTDTWGSDGEGSFVRTLVHSGQYTDEQAGGLVTAVGDLNGDGQADLVSGNPFEPGADPHGALGGKVTVTYGGGVTGGSGATVVIDQNTAGIPGVSEAGDRFGAALSIGDTDKDGYADLVIGSPGEDGASGAVTVIRGGAGGLVTTAARGVSQNTAGVPGSSEAGDAFGSSVLLRDCTKDGAADLVVGGPGEDGGDGAMWLLRGAVPSQALGITAAGAGLSTSGTPHFGSVSTSSR